MKCSAVALPNPNLLRAAAAFAAFWVHGDPDVEVARRPAVPVVADRVAAHEEVVNPLRVEQE
jgi:hypothetical protein